MTHLSEQPGLPIQDYGPFVILDVTGGLKDPQALLDGLLAQRDDALHPLIIPAPNIAFMCAESCCCSGSCATDKRAIRDRPRGRLFTFRTWRPMVRNADLQIQVMKDNPATIPTDVGDTHRPRAALWLSQAVIRVRPILSCHQVFVSASLTPEETTFVASARANAKTDPQ